MSYSSDNLSSLSEPYQPQNISFPKTQYNVKGFKRSFQSAWFERFPWLHYDIEKDAAFCFICIKALNAKAICSSKLEKAFVTEGFRNWKKACEKECGFHKHQGSNCHLEAVERYKPPCEDIGTLMSSKYEEERMANRAVLLKIFSTLRYLGESVCLSSIQLSLVSDLNNT